SKSDPSFRRLTSWQQTRCMYPAGPSDIVGGWGGNNSANGVRNVMILHAGRTDPWVKLFWPLLMEK
ncbi:MAG: hypothetical protein ACRD3Q_21060, partial [Terriglobales bacterium]